MGVAGCIHRSFVVFAIRAIAWKSCVDHASFNYSVSPSGLRRSRISLFSVVFDGTTSFGTSLCDFSSSESSDVSFVSSLSSDSLSTRLGPACLVSASLSASPSRARLAERREYATQSQISANAVTAAARKDRSMAWRLSVTFEGPGVKSAYRFLTHPG